MVTRLLSPSGLIGSIFSVLQFLWAPLTGAVSDCLGRRPVMLLSLVRVPLGWYRRGQQLLCLSQAVPEPFLPPSRRGHMGPWVLQNRAGIQGCCWPQSAPPGLK